MNNACPATVTVQSRDWLAGGNGSGSHSCCTDQVPSSKYENYFQLLLWSVCSIKIADLIWSQWKQLWLPRPKLFCWRIISRELDRQPEKPADRYSRNTRLNLLLPSRRPQVPCWVMWKHTLHLTHGYSFFSLFTNCTHADDVTVYPTVLSMNVTKFNIILLMIKVTIKQPFSHCVLHIRYCDKHFSYIILFLIFTKTLWEKFYYYPHLLLFSKMNIW